MKRWGVITFPGSNCDRDMLSAVGELGDSEAVSIWHKDTDLQGCDIIVLPGGFSYGDYLRSGAIARFAPVMEAVKEFALGGGKVLGICNGFQILTEAGLLPGALLANPSRKFICENIYLSVQSGRHGIASANVLKIPIAHGEGRYYADDRIAKELEEKGCILFRYCNSAGDISEENNPNGSLQNIAGICNEAGNVWGMMPHPERAVSAVLGNEDGKVILQAFAEHVPVF
jgi:phosphoribosylformylglycinamidine synthase subunit PurQ / glutaminase